MIPSPLQEIVLQVIVPRYQTFQTWPAAKMYHHARIGGLLEHSLEVARIALEIAAPIWDGFSPYDPTAIVYGNRIRRWPTVDVGLLLAAALLHDVGKMDEFAVEASILYSDLGHSLGHIHLGLFLVRDACNICHLDTFDSARLLHCIASHHGVPDYGSTIRPMTAEAIVLNQADELSAQLEMVSEALASDPTGSRGWSERIPTLDRRLWLKAARVARNPTANTAVIELDDLPF
jgi:3'-5' exoribonuclease